MENLNIFEVVRKEQVKGSFRAWDFTRQQG